MQRIDNRRCRSSCRKHCYLCGYLLYILCAVSSHFRSTASASEPIGLEQDRKTRKSSSKGKISGSDLPTEAKRFFFVVDYMAYCVVLGNGVFDHFSVAAGDDRK
jgi:hypothetical protein